MELEKYASKPRDPDALQEGRMVPRVQECLSRIDPELRPSSPLRRSKACMDPVTVHDIAVSALLMIAAHHSRRH